MQQYEDGWTAGDMSNASASSYTLGLFGFCFGVGALITLVILTL